MKATLLLPILLLTAAPVLAQYQPPPPTEAEKRAAAKAAQESGVEQAEPFKGANLILIHTADSAGVALKKLARALITSGIDPDKVDADIGYLTTKDKPVGQLSPAIYTYRAVSSAEPGGTLLTISGGFTKRVNLGTTISVPMAWFPSTIMEARQCFDMVQAAALTYPGAKLAYKYKQARPTTQQR